MKRIFLLVFALILALIHAVYAFADEKTDYLDALSLRASGEYYEVSQEDVANSIALLGATAMLPSFVPDGYSVYIEEKKLMEDPTQVLISQYIDAETRGDEQTRSALYEALKIKREVHGSKVYEFWVLPDFTRYRAHFIYTNDNSESFSLTIRVLPGCDVFSGTVNPTGGVLENGLKYQIQGRFYEGDLIIIRAIDSALYEMRDAVKSEHANKPYAQYELVTRALQEEDMMDLLCGLE